MRRNGVVTVLLWLLTAAPTAGQDRAQRDIRPGLQITALEERYPVAEERPADVIDALNIEAQDDPTGRRTGSC